MEAELERTITTLRPDGKKGFTMKQHYYESLSAYILGKIKAHENLTMPQLLEYAQHDLPCESQDMKSWYVLQVKLDLEARDLIRTTKLPYDNRAYFLKITRKGKKQTLVAV
ncbi:hypothetical protein D4L85_00890 [Chryseolinea soli]|uniref:Uncharacterized protein n=2 Tax=Chryseolinea soli TaxID=2321403 RepID=A0A385SC66_9BACT|nr:hypothetical protein D4L85_00890 [Chryseolinea soli]